MSEYQYYDFRAIDRPLTSSHRAELAKISTRAEISSTRFTNFYTFGDFKGNPVALVVAPRAGEGPLGLRARLGWLAPAWFIPARVSDLASSAKPVSRFATSGEISSLASIRY